MSIKAVIFDVGGVLMRTEDKEPRAALGLRFGKTYQEMDKIVFGNKSSAKASVGEISARNHWENIMRSLSLPDEGIDNFYAQFFSGDAVDYVLIDYIRTLRPRYTTAIISNAWDDLRDIIVSKWHIDDAFNEIFISAEIGIAKPDVRIYEYALEKLNIVPEEALFIDDFIENIETARNLGMQGIHFQESSTVMAKLQELL